MCAVLWWERCLQYCLYKEGFTVEIGIIFKIALVGILRQSGREEQAFLTSLAGLLIVLYWVIPYIVDLFETIERLFDL